jgi:hypothetical protein
MDFTDGRGPSVGKDPPARIDVERVTGREDRLGPPAGAIFRSFHPKSGSRDGDGHVLKHDLREVVPLFE